jgi:hypothetical protein
MYVCQNKNDLKIKVCFPLWHLHKVSRYLPSLRYDGPRKFDVIKLWQFTQNIRWRELAVCAMVMRPLAYRSRHSAICQWMRSEVVAKCARSGEPVLHRWMYTYSNTVQTVASMVLSQPPSHDTVPLIKLNLYTLFKLCWVWVRHRCKTLCSLEQETLNIVSCLFWKCFSS